MLDTRMNVILGSLDALLLFLHIYQDVVQIDGAT